MIIDLNLTLENVCLFTGEHALTSSQFSPLELLQRYIQANRISPAAEIQQVLDDPGHDIGIMILWERLPFLNVELLFGPQLSNPECAYDVPEHMRILADVIGQEPTIPRSLQKDAQRFVTLKCPANVPLSISEVLDSSHPDIISRERTTEGGREGISFEMDILIYVPGQRQEVARFEVMSRVVPGSRPEKYDGILAIDFGNTRSFMVCMGKSDAWLQHLDEGEPFEVVYLDPEDQGDDPTVFSALGIKRLSNPLHELQYHRARYEIGRRAMDAADGLILGPKRIVVDPRKEEPHELTKNGRPIGIPKSVPAELYLSRLIQTFVRAKNAVPTELRITYPTTFSLRETDELRLSLYDAMRLSVGTKNRLGVMTKADRRERRKRVNKAVPMPVDEASSAASYLLFRDDVLGPGGIRSFMDLYPDGLNILVYDCGGGTTDIALVHAEGGCAFDETVGRETFSFEVKNLARTGHRSFGGDEMTLAVFRLMKTQLARSIASAALRDGKIDNSSSLADAASITDVTNLTDAQSRAISKIVPTQWNRLGAEPSTRVRRHDVNDVSERQQVVLELWEAAESIKRELAKPKQNSIRIGAAKAWKDLTKTLFEFIARNHPTLAALDRAEIYEEWDDISVSRTEVDTVLEPLVMETVEKMNFLIDHKLNRNEQIDRIYIVGNGSRYPLIRECITEHMKVQFVEEKTRQEDIQTKLAVAKGACISAWLARNNELVQWDADKDLMHRIPYDVVLGGLGGGQPEDLYQEGEDCRNLPPMQIPVRPPIDDKQPAPQVMMLFRRWPGDISISKFMEFRFDRPLTGPVTVWFEPDEQTFFMRDEGVSAYGAGRTVRGREVIEADYVQHVQSGLI